MPRPKKPKPITQDQFNRLSSDDVARWIAQDHDYKLWRERMIDKVAIVLGVLSIIAVGLIWWLYMLGG